MNLEQIANDDLKLEFIRQYGINDDTTAFMRAVECHYFKDYMGSLGFLDMLRRHHVAFENHPDVLFLIAKNYVYQIMDELYHGVSCDSWDLKHYKRQAEEIMQQMPRPNGHDEEVSKLQYLLDETFTPGKKK